MAELHRLGGVCRLGKGVKQVELGRLELAKTLLETRGTCPCLGGVSIPSGVSQCSPFLPAAGSPQTGVGMWNSKIVALPPCAGQGRAVGQGPQSQQEKVAVFSSQYSACPILFFPLLTSVLLFTPFFRNSGCGQWPWHSKISPFPIFWSSSCRAVPYTPLSNLPCPVESQNGLEGP